ncbi:hypothetical protein GCM10010446_23990 [Streptomyces enissocaesilis]|uniref:Uncharacterized protein n=1 Tax=Streptomyces enissocaesilis TaxID=332589 RepID=A0ABN3X7I9_9ACTN
MPAAPPTARGRAAAEAVAACLRAGEGRPAAEPGPGRGHQVRLLAASVRIRGLNRLRSVVSAGVCRAASLTLQDARLDYGAEGARVCVVASEAEVRGGVRLGADTLRDRVFGRVPVALSTRVPLPLPPVVPYVEPTDVQGQDVTFTADEMDAPGVLITAGDACPAP